MLGYESIKLHEKKQHLLGPWDWFVMWNFMSLMRVRNDRCFSWWASINAAASYGAFLVKSRMKILVYFGQSTVQYTLLRKIKEFLEYSHVMKQTNLTLRASGDYGVGMYDNSQCQQSIKFQPGSHSSSVTKTTSRLFIKPFIPPYLEGMSEL